MRFHIKSFLYCNKFRVDMIIIKTEMSVRKINRMFLELVLLSWAQWIVAEKKKEKTKVKKKKEKVDKEGWRERGIEQVGKTSPAWPFMEHWLYTRHNFGSYSHFSISKQLKYYYVIIIQDKNLSSEMLGTRDSSDFFVCMFWIFAYIRRYLGMRSKSKPKITCIFMFHLHLIHMAWR